MTLVTKTPMINPQWNHCSIEERLKSEGFVFKGQIENLDLVREIQSYLADPGIKDFRIIPGYIAKEGSENEDLQENYHLLYTKT